MGLDDAATHSWIHIYFRVAGWVYRTTLQLMKLPDNKPWLDSSQEYLGKGGQLNIRGFSAVFSRIGFVTQSMGI